MAKQYSLHYGRYPTRAKAKAVAKRIRDGKVAIPAVYAPNGFYAQVRQTPMPDGQYGVYIKRRQYTVPGKGEYQRLVKKYMPLLTKRELDAKKAMKEIATFSTSSGRPTG